MAGLQPEFTAYQIKKPKRAFRPFMKDLAATYSRGSYTTTTIGNAAFDGRVRDGIGSGHSFMVTKNKTEQVFLENCVQTGHSHVAS